MLWYNQYLSHIISSYAWWAFALTTSIHRISCQMDRNRCSMTRHDVPKPGHYWASVWDVCPAVTRLWTVVDGHTLGILQAFLAGARSGWHTATNYMTLCACPSSHYVLSILTSIVPFTSHGSVRDNHAICSIVLTLYTGTWTCVQHASYPDPQEYVWEHSQASWRKIKTASHPSQRF